MSSDTATKRKNVSSPNEKAADDGLMAEYFTRDQLADELGMNVRSLERWASLRKGPPRIKVGNRVFYHRAAVRSWLARQEVPA